MRGYHFVGNKLHDGRPVPADGEWLEHEGPLIMCDSGFHWSEHPSDALKYSPRNPRWLCLIEADGETLREEGKSVSRRRRIVARVEVAPLVRAYTRWCASQLQCLWDLADHRWAAVAPERQRAHFLEMVEAAFGGPR